MKHPLSIAHKLSRRFVIDPAYSAKVPFPPLESYPMAMEDEGPVSWVYAPGDLEAFLLARMKHEGFRDSKEVAHPGLFRAPATIAYFRLIISLSEKELGRHGVLVIRHTGVLRLSIDFVAYCHHVAQAGEIGAARINLRGKLKKGRNTLELVISSVGEPCTFWTGYPGLNSDDKWVAGHDNQRWTRPTFVRVVEGTEAPHKQELPTVPIKPVALAEDLYQVTPLVVGSLEMRARKATKIALRAGESPLEARSEKSAEQVVLRHNARANETVRMSRAAMSHFSLGAGSADITSLVCHADSYPVSYRGAFACDDAVLTRIWMHSAYTLRCCMRELLVDGLKRDRMPWVGDLFVTVLSSVATFGVAGPIRRTLVALAGLNPRETRSNGIVDYTLYWLMSIERYDWHFRDPHFIESSRSTIVEMLAGLAASEDADGWLIPREHDWLFLDWAKIEKKGAVAALQFLYVWALRSVEQLAARVGWSDLQRQAKGKRVRLEIRAQRAFWDARRGGFVEALLDGRQSPMVKRHATIFAVLSGAASAGQRRTLLKQVLDNPAVPNVGTPYMRFFENLARARLGALDSMAADIRGYWGGMLDEGATTFWEAYEPTESAEQHLAFYGRPFGRSLCHAWASGPAHLLSGELSGLQMLEPRWGSFSLKRARGPVVPLHICMPTLAGEIVLDRTEDKTELRIPEGSVFVDRSGGKARRIAGPRSVTIR